MFMAFENWVLTSCFSTCYNVRRVAKCDFSVQPLSHERDTSEESFCANSGTRGRIGVFRRCERGANREKRPSSGR